jgi:histone demethylase JARID1
LENNPLPRPVLLKLARKGGVKRVRGTAYYDTVNGITKDDIESEYWNTVDNFDNSVQRTVTVQYGSDLDCTQVGSCFPKTYPYGWNMNKLAILDDSVLKYLYQTIPGITSPMLYVGMLFSSFCWHVEDNFLCAINYIHSGANKTWYAIPGSAAQAFEKVMRDTLPDLFENQPNLLQMLITMLSPRVLQQHNVPIYRMQHEAGSFIITYPRAYHAGFNHGFNIAESVNFSPGTWLPYGRICINKYHHTHRPTAFAHDQIICTAAIRDNISQFTADVHAIIIAELELIIKLEEKLRKYVEDVVGITRKEAMPDSKKHPHRSRKVSVQKDNKICLNCKQDCYLSGIMIDQSVMQIPSPNAQSKKRTSSMMMGMKAMQCDENEPSEPFVCLKCVETYIQNKDISVKNCALVERYTIAQLRELHKDATETKPKKYKESKTKKRKSQDNMVDE